jgi:hypothetical protein
MLDVDDSDIILNGMNILDDSPSIDEVDVGNRYAAVIERVYRIAIAHDATPLSHFALAKYLESHGRISDSLRELNELLAKTIAKGDEAYQLEIESQISRLKQRLAGSNSFEW